MHIFGRIHLLCPSKCTRGEPKRQREHRKHEKKEQWREVGLQSSMSRQQRLHAGWSSINSTHHI